MNAPNVWIKHNEHFYALTTRKGFRFRLVYVKTRNEWRVRGLLMKPRYFLGAVTNPPRVWATKIVYLWLREAAETMEVEAIMLDRDYENAQESRKKKFSPRKAREATEDTQRVVHELVTTSQDPVILP